jgi:hypothetical protein
MNVEGRGIATQTFSVDVAQENTFLNEVGQQIQRNNRFQTWRNRWIIIIAMMLSFFIYMVAGVIGYLHVRPTEAPFRDPRTGHADCRS